jgi:hypothetical protein
MKLPQSPTPDIPLRHRAAHAGRSGRTRAGCWSGAFHLTGRVVCGLIAAMHVVPLWRVTLRLFDSGPTAPLVITWLVLALLVGALFIKAAGRAFIPARTRRASTLAMLLACAVCHGEVLVSAGQLPAMTAVLTAGGTAGLMVVAARRFRVGAAGRSPSIDDLFASACCLHYEGCSVPPLLLVVCGPQSPRGPPRRAQAIMV